MFISMVQAAGDSRHGEKNHKILGKTLSRYGNLQMKVLARVSNKTAGHKSTAEKSRTRLFCLQKCSWYSLVDAKIRRQDTQLGQGIAQRFLIGNFKQVIAFFMHNGAPVFD